MQNLKNCCMGGEIQISTNHQKIFWLKIFGIFHIFGVKACIACCSILGLPPTRAQTMNGPAEVLVGKSILLDKAYLNILVLKTPHKMFIVSWTWLQWEWEGIVEMRIWRLVEQHRGNQKTLDNLNIITNIIYRAVPTHVHCAKDIYLTFFNF